MLVRFRQDGTGEEYAINPDHVAAVVFEKYEDGTKRRLLIRTVDGCEYDVAEGFEDVIRRLGSPGGEQS